MRFLTTDDKIRFSPGETLILSMLIELGRKVYGDDRHQLETLDGIEQALLAGEHEDAIGEWLYPDGHPKALKTEVIAILDMWDALELALELLPDANRKAVVSRLGEFGELDVCFRGYDSHHVPGEEGYLGYTRYVLDRGRFVRFKDRDVSGTTSGELGRYRAMLKKWDGHKEAAKQSDDRRYEGVFNFPAMHRGMSDSEAKRCEDVLVDMFSTRDEPWSSASARKTPTSTRQ